MLKDITLGQYFPGDTVVHRLDPRTKLLMVIVYIVALFLAKWVISYAVMLAFLVTAVALSRIRPRALFKGLKPLLFIIIFTAIINVFYTKGDVLVQFWIFKITREGLVNAGFLVLRIVMLVTGTFLLTYTTSPIALTDGLESLLSPLKAIHFPVHELALMMSIALRFIPTLIEETDKIISAQKAVARILKREICSTAQRPLCRSSCRCSSARSGAPTSWPRPWSAAATAADPAARS